MEELLKCAKRDCSHYAFLRPESEHYCDLHRKEATTASAGGGCISALLILAFMALAFVVVLHTISNRSADGSELCWVIDVAWRWEDQEHDLLACTPVVVRSRTTER